MIKVIYNKVCGRCVQSEPLTSGMVGQLIHFEYSHDFDGLAVTAVFTDGKNTVDVVNPGNECIIPHEVLTTVGAIVKVGIYAVKGDELVIPTIYAHIGIVLKGADPSGDVSIDPTLPIWAQTQALIGNLSQIETETKDSLVAAINEVKQTADRKANAADLAPVAISGSYSDLTDKPTIPSVPTATIEANTAARHTHDNKTLLDSITEALKTAWNTASEWVITNGANVLSHLADGVKHITAAERTKWNDKQDKLIAGENITIAADGKTISATGGGSGGVQPDWNQNDNTAADYVKNRPFYTGDPVEIEIIPSTTVTFSDGGGIMAATWPENFDLVDGQMYTISWDGTDYVCTGILFRNIPLLGNLGIAQAGADTGEPFIFMNQGKWLVASTESATEHIIGIKTISTPIVQIDKKYLPEATNTSSGITKTQVRNLDTTKSYSAEEIKEIYQDVLDGTAIYLSKGEVITYISYNYYDGEFIYILASGQKETIHPVDGVWNFANRETTYPDTVTFRSQYSNYAYIQSSPIGAGGIDQQEYELISTNIAGFMGSYIQAERALVLSLKDVPKYLYISANGNGEIEVVTRNSGSTSGGDTTTLFKNGDNSMILKSSTEGSTKKFKITVDDAGTLSATEVTA